MSWFTTALSYYCWFWNVSSVEPTALLHRHTQTLCFRMILTNFLLLSWAFWDVFFLPLLWLEQSVGLDGWRRLNEWKQCVATTKAKLTPVVKWGQWWDSVQRTARHRESLGEWNVRLVSPRCHGHTVTDCVFSVLSTVWECVLLCHTVTHLKRALGSTRNTSSLYTAL